MRKNRNNLPEANKSVINATINLCEEIRIKSIYDQH